MGYFEGRRVLLVGGSEGIGRQTALELCRRGAHVVIAARRQGPLDEALALMQPLAKGRVGAVAMDIVDRASVRAAVPVVEEQLGGGVDVIVVNAGSARPGYVHELDDADFDAMIAVNYAGHANVVRAFLPGMMARKKGDVCFVSSALGFMSMPGYSAYSASKFAVAGFAEALHVELRPHDIRVSVFYPGTTDTPGLVNENASKPRAVWLMESDSAFSKTHAPESVANKLLAGIEGGRFENFPGLDVWFIWWVYHWFPSLARWMAHDEWKKALAKAEAEAKAEGKQATA
ncbi:MAG: SDR family NAD(P)-dependent oxidoreductase [Alphaproteobacteria bacterium]|nr:SDR family NAD(P)-dependent oxidoreductase [Alphaproteobacteria bacterium]